MTTRRGAAMLAAIWFVVAITAATLHFTLAGRERRAIGLAAAERGWGEGLLLGGLAKLQSRMDNDLRLTALNAASLQGSRASDAWLDADSIYTDIMDVDSNDVSVEVIDLGMRLNINTATEVQFRGMFRWLLDGETATQLAAAIMDWRDADANTRVGGAEKPDYLDAGYLALPANRLFRDPSDLRLVYGMSDDVYELIAPFMTTVGTTLINVNTAPEEVLRAIPGISDDIVANILNYHQRRLRITNLATVVPNAAQLAQMTPATTLTTNQLLVKFQARPGRAARPVSLSAYLTRAGTTVTIGWKQW